MKILDKYILKSFLITFTSVFVILFFIFILQGIWLFIAELAGKDLDFIIILKFLSFYAPNVIPLVLPLSVLLASIMTFGSFSENYEFAAMKSSGISLQRAMKYLTFFILGLSLVAFVFSNNVIPQAQFKFINLRQNIVRQKPAMAIAQGQFNQIGNINIKVEEKSGDRGQFLKGIIIHKKSSNGNGASTIINANNGVLSSDESANLLNLELFDGNYYEDILPTKYEEQKKMPFAKSTFKKYVLTIDVGKLNTSSEDESLVNTEQMLNISELNITIDSLQKKFNNDVVSFSDNISQRTTNVFTSKKIQYITKDTIIDNLLDIYPIVEQKKIIEIATNNITSLNFAIESSKNDLDFKKKNINQHYTSIHEKFMLAFSCLLMFFIGAPLGAIIRKGGLGLPMIFAILIFIAFHFINTFGRKLAQEDSISPFLGTWMSSIILIPFAILLTYRATNDIGIMINFDWITDPIKKLFIKNHNHSFSKEIVSLDSLKYEINDEEYTVLNTKDDTVLKGIVKNSEQYGYSTNYRLKTLKILESRGISQEQLKLENKLYNRDYLQLKYNIQEYKFNSNIALLVYFLSIILPLGGNLIMYILGLLFILSFYYFIYKSTKDLNEISKLINKKPFVNNALSIIFSFPFYIIIYFLNKSAVNKVLLNYNK